MIGHVLASRFRVLKGGRDRMTSLPQDKRLRPVYSIEEASEYLRIPINTLYAWAIGRRKAHSSDYYEPVLSFVDQQTRRLSFFDLVEAHILRAAVDENVPLSQIKRGLLFLRERHPRNPRPLLTYDFKTDGKYLLVGGMLGSKKKDRDKLINASKHGQIEITGVIEEYIRLIKRDASKMPDTLFPKEGQKVISITSGVVSGRPVIAGTRIPTSIIAQRFRAGEQLKDLAKDYRLPKEKIEAAIQYETAA